MDAKLLIAPTFHALKLLGGSATTDEMLNQVVTDMKLPDDVIDIVHSEQANQSELQYQLAWARTYLKKYGIIDRSARAVWVIKPEYTKVDSVDTDKIVKKIVKDGRIRRSMAKESKKTSLEDNIEDAGIDAPEEIAPWRTELESILKTMNPYGFERLAQRLLRECGFSSVVVTKKSGDGGIDGTGKLKINGIFSFNVAFQCKRYKDQVGAAEIRDFRGSLTTDIEKGVMITTGTFSKAARLEASNHGKKQIDLIDGEEFINKLIEYGIGVKPVTSYEIDNDFFDTFNEEKK